MTFAEVGIVKLERQFFRPFPPVLAGCLLVGRRLGGDGLLRSAMVAEVASTLFR